MDTLKLCEAVEQAFTCRVVEGRTPSCRPKANFLRFKEGVSVRAVVEFVREQLHVPANLARPFTETDWMGLAGATCWPGNDTRPDNQPVIREFISFCIVADRTSVQLISADLEQWQDMPGVKFPCQAPALAFLNGLPKQFNPEEYGFVPST